MALLICQGDALLTDRLEKCSYHKKETLSVPMVTYDGATLLLVSVT